MSRWDRFLSSEIEIEFKASLYFYTMLFFYFGTLLLKGSLSASVVIIVEMIAAAYIMGFVQVYLLGNFDESEIFTWREAVKIAGCSLMYTAVSWLCGWFERDPIITAVYFFFMLICYGCVCWLYCVRRSICTRQMNSELEAFKKKKAQPDTDTI